MKYKLFFALLISTILTSGSAFAAEVDISTNWTDSPEALAEASYIQTYVAQHTSLTRQLLPPDGGSSFTYPSSLILSPFTHYAQINNYFCGPAVGQMILNYMGKQYSADQNLPLTQANLGSGAYMKTSINGSTRWDSGNWASGMNAWIGSTTFYQLHAPSADMFKSIEKYNLYVGQPIAVDTVEMANDPHYNHHPLGQTIGHWLAVYGYSGSGSTTYFADPSTSVWSGVSAKFTSSTVGFVQTYLANNGVAF